MKDTFFNISKNKQKNLFQACLEEFSAHNYESSSINRIIKIAGISKGGLYRYISSKRDLYIYVISNIMEEVISYQASHISESETCLFIRLKTLLNYGFEYYEHNQLAFRVILNGFYDITSPAYDKIGQIRKDLIKKHQNNLIEGINWQQYNLSKEKVLTVAEYLIEGFNMTLLKKISSNTALEEFKNIVNEDIEILISTLRKGLVGGHSC